MLNVYCSLVEREFKATKSLKQCQGLTAVILDEYIATDVIDDKFKDYLVDVLSSRFQQNSEMITEGTKFLTETKTLIELIQSVKRFNDTQEDQKTSALMRVMQYVFAADQQQIFLKYLLKLADVHAVNANYIEAGLTLLLHANKLTWSNDKILPALSTEFPEESERARKEKLYNKAIVYFDKGKDWERAIGLIRELSPIYEHETGEYKKLAAVLRQMGEFFEKINDSKRFFASYFYVAYYGKGFDDWGLRNNQYIYRGNEAERLMDFVERIMKRFPNAEMLKPMAPVTDEVLNGDGQYIQLMTVYPVEFGDIKTKCSPKDRNENISMNIAGYSQANKVKVFNYFRTYRMHPKDKEMNEISDLYTNITFLIIGKENTDIDTDDFLATNSFPTIVRRKRVIDTVEVILSPIENAVKNIEDKNTEIMELVISHRLDAKPDTGKVCLIFLFELTILAFYAIERNNRCSCNGWRWQIFVCILQQRICIGKSKECWCIAKTTKSVGATIGCFGKGIAHVSYIRNCCDQEARRTFIANV
jgi:tetratricopeptide (TPR) repeat protein